MQRIWSVPAWRWLAVLLTAWGLGCTGSDGLNPVEGQVFFKNEPLKGAVLTFHRKGADPVKTHPPVGSTNDQGTFTLTTGDKEGAVEGEYVVTLILPKEVASPKSKRISTALPDSRDAFDGAYSDPNKSVWKVAIKRGNNKLEPFHLK
jgi:hypothetical protein